MRCGRASPCLRRLKRIAGDCGFGVILTRNTESSYTSAMSSPLLFAIASLIWGSTFWAITLQLGEVPPAVSVAYRFGLAAATLFAMCALRGDRLLLPWRTQRWMMLQGFLTFGLSYVCTYGAEQYLVSALVAVLFALMVFWTPLCSRVAFGTPIGWRTWAAGAVAMAGVALLFSRSIGSAWQDILAGGSGDFLLGLVLALVATIASSAGSVIVGKVQQQSSNLILTMAWSMLWGTLLVLAYVGLTGQPLVLPAAPRYWMGLFYLSIFGSVIAFMAYVTLINRIGSQKAVYIGVVTPVISVLLSIRLEQYRPGPLEWLGMILCLSSVAWAVRAPPPRPAPPSTHSRSDSMTPASAFHVRPPSRPTIVPYPRHDRRAGSVRETRAPGGGQRGAAARRPVRPAAGLRGDHRRAGRRGGQLRPVLP
jgi:drug/metabolite transporter (DMT)-like permease